MTDNAPKTADKSTQTSQVPEGIPAPQPIPPKPKRSPFMKKMLTETGSVVDLAGRALVAVAFAALFIKPQNLPFPGSGAMFALGVILVVIGIYTKAEAER